MAKHQAGEPATYDDITATPFELAMLAKQYQAVDDGRDPAWWKNTPTHSECRATRRSLLRLQQIGAVDRVKQGRYTLSNQAVEKHIIMEMIAADETEPATT